MSIKKYGNLLVILAIAVVAVISLWIYNAGKEQIDDDAPEQETLDYNLVDGAKRGSIDSVKVLVNAGANVNAETESGYTPLQMAAAKGHKEIVEFLIGKGADVNAKGPSDLSHVSQLRTALHWAAYFGYKDIVELLIVKGADINARDQDDRTPIHLSALFDDKSFGIHQYGQYGWIRRIFSRQKRVSVTVVEKRNGESDPTVFADFTKLLIDMGAEINVQDSDGKTPLDLAIDTGNDEVKDVLKKHGAEESK